MTAEHKRLAEAQSANIGTNIGVAVPMAYNWCANSDWRISSDWRINSD